MLVTLKFCGLGNPDLVLFPIGMPTVLFALVVGVALHPEHGTVLQATHACGEAKQPDGTGADMEECARNYTAADVLASSSGGELRR